MERTSAPPVQLEYEGKPVLARAGETVAVALFAEGNRVLSRSIKYHRPRSFFCLAGHCGACLMRVDGKPNVRACRTLVREGMTVERQNAFPSGGFDVLGAADFFFPKGMDHHTLMTKPRALNAVMQKVVRQLAGLGKLPEAPRAPAPAMRSRHVEVAVIGGGPAGLAAATGAARRGRAVLLIDEQDRVGGSLLAHPAHGLAAADAALADARAAGVEIWSHATAFAWYGEDVSPAARVAGPGLLAVQTPDGLVQLTADRYVYATGAYDQNALFPGNDCPGVLAARAVGRLLLRWGVVAGERPVVVGGGPYAKSLAQALEQAGAAVRRIDGSAERVVAASGHGWVKAIDIEKDGVRTRLRCDLVAIAALPAPASELPRQHGVRVEHRVEAGGFHCTAGEHGATALADVWVCGDVCGVIGPAAAAAAGARTGEAL